MRIRNTWTDETSQIESGAGVRLEMEVDLPAHAASVRHRRCAVEKAEVGRVLRNVLALKVLENRVVIGQDWPPNETGDVRVVLFVKLQDGLTLDSALAEQVKQTIRANTTPRHVPAKVVQVSDIPRTKSGKIVELAVRNVVHGRDVKNIEALANPEALEQYRDREELRT